MIPHYLVHQTHVKDRLPYRCGVVALRLLRRVVIGAEQLGFQCVNLIALFAAAAEILADLDDMAI